MTQNDAGSFIFIDKITRLDFFEKLMFGFTSTQICIDL